jgi:hypothetical protein
MVSLAALWLPILVAAVLVFIASSLIHMLLGYHHADYDKLAEEDKVMDALRPFNLPPGDYVTPCPTSPASMRDPEFLARRKRGPVFMMTVWPAGDIRMGGQLAQWFVFAVIVNVFTAYVATLALPAGAPYMEVFQVTSTVSFIAYGMALWELSIWYRRKWATTLRSNIDSLIYGLLIGGVFGWLWP